MPTMVVGPAQGSLRLLTGVEGASANLGHALTLHVADWSCRTELEDDVPVAVTLDGHLPSLTVVAGRGGLVPLTDRQRSKIRQSALSILSAARAPTFTYVSSQVRRADGGWHLVGELALAGVRREVGVDVALADLPGGHRILARTSVRQSDFGIKPYSGMLGTLLVRNLVEVVVDVRVPLDGEGHPH